MKVQLKGLNSGFIVTFYSTIEYYKLHGIYSQNEPTTWDFHGFGFDGFNGSLPITSGTDKGAGENGVTWNGNSLGSRVITWNFENNFEEVNGASPTRILNSLMTIKDEIIEVTVNDEFVAKFFFNPTSSTNNGIIALESAETGDGIYWSKGNFTSTKTAYREFPKIPKKLPKQLLYNSNLMYPIKNIVMSEVDLTKPLTTIGGQSSGNWLDFKLETPEQTITYDNSINKDKFIIIDSVNLTIVNEDGTSRVNEVVLVSGTSKFPILNAGFNEFKVSLSNCDVYADLFYNGVPYDFKIDVNYNLLTSTISEGS